MTWTAVLFLSLTAVGWRDCSAVQIASSTSGDNGNFLSPNYPHAYPNDVQGKYRHYFTGTGPMQIRLEYTADLPNATVDGCSDYVTVGTDTTQHCGTWEGVEYLTLESNLLYLVFSSDESGTARGFNYTFSVLQGTCEPILNFYEVYEHQVMPIVDMLSRDSLLLQVRACTSMHIAFATDYTNIFLASRVIVLGGWDNTRSRLSNCINAASYAWCWTLQDVFHSPLDCCEFRAAWFTWSDVTVACGLGSAIGENVVFNYTFAETVPVRYITMTGFGSYPLVTNFSASFPDEYCQTPADLTPQSECIPTPAPGSASTPASANSATSPGSNNMATTSGSGGGATSSGSPFLFLPSATVGGLSSSTSSSTSNKGVTGTASTSSSTGSFPTSGVTSTVGDVTDEASTNSNDATTADGKRTTTSVPGTAQETTTALAAVAPSPKEQPPPSTTSSSQSNSREFCWCNCLWVPPPPPSPNGSQQLSPAELEKIYHDDLSEEIKRNLTLPTHNMSKTVRRYISAEDVRPSAQTLGFVGGIVGALPIALFVITDVICFLVAIGKLVLGVCRFGRGQ